MKLVITISHIRTVVFMPDVALSDQLKQEYLKPKLRSNKHPVSPQFACFCPVWIS